MEIVATRVNEHGEMEYTVVPTVEERNWMAAYKNMRDGLFDFEKRSLDKFAFEAIDYGSVKSRSFTRLLDAWRCKISTVHDIYLEPMYGAVITYDEAECLRAYRHMTSRFNNCQVDMLGHVIDMINKYDPEKRGLMLDVMAQAVDLIGGGADLLKVKAE